MYELDNSQWGFESNCFVCERSNERGLRIPFAHDPERDVVTATFTLDRAFSGAPRYGHGGVVLAILDEAMAWATIAVAHRFSVTKETTAHFDRPVRIEKPHVVESRVIDVGDELLTTEATVHDERARPCVRAHATFVSLGEAQAARAIGTDLAAEAASYVRR